MFREVVEGLRALPRCNANKHAITARCSADIGDAHTDQNDGASRRPGISISIIPHISAVPYILRSICLSSYRFHLCRSDITTSYHHYPPTV